MNKQEYFDFQKAEFERMMEITKAKNHDYTGSSADPFANFAAVEALGICSTETGFMVRLMDKFMRINSFIQKGTLEVSDESVQDTCRDAANYFTLLNGYIESKRRAKAQDNK